MLSLMSRVISRGVGSKLAGRPLLQAATHEGDAGQLLADAVVQILANPPLLTLADFQHLPFQDLTL